LNNIFYTKAVEMENENLIVEIKIRLLEFIINNKIQIHLAITAFGFLFKMYFNPIWDTQIVGLTAVGLIIFLNLTKLFSSEKLIVIISSLVLIITFGLMIYILFYKGVYGIITDEGASTKLIALRIGLIIFGLSGVETVYSTIINRNNKSQR